MEYTLTDFMCEAQRDDGDFYICTLDKSTTGYFRILSVDSGILVDVTDLFGAFLGLGVDSNGWVWSPFIPVKTFLAGRINLLYGYDVYAEDSEINMDTAFIYI